MKKYCNCNSYWGYDTLITEGMIVEMVNYCGYIPGVDFSVGSRINDRCPVCKYNFWYRAHEENMMFDLKNMNS